MRTAGRIESAGIQRPRCHLFAVGEQRDVAQIYQTGLRPAVGARDFEQDVIDRAAACRSRGQLLQFAQTLLFLQAQPVLFLLPYREFQGDNAGPVAATKKYASWMRAHMRTAE